MTGRVRSREAYIRFRVRGPSGRSEQIDAIVDTGFTGWLTLPRETISRLGLEWLHEGLAQLANGSTTTFNVYGASVIWNRRVRKIHVDESETTPLVGMSLLAGCELRIDVRLGGKVSIRPFADSRQ